MAEAATDLRPAPEVAPEKSPADAPKTPAPVVVPPPPEEVEPSGGSYIMVRDRYTIYCDRHIPSLDMPSALAYEVEDKKQGGVPLYALICKPEIPSRISVMHVFKGLEIPSVLHLVDWGVAEWPPADRKSVILIYHRPMGGRVMESLAASFKRIPDHQFARAVIKPLADGLADLSQKGISHRSIRPDNLYYLDEARTKIVLGDCVTSVPGIDQPVVVESIESGMAIPSGRGTGTHADDMYALGASLLILALGRNPLHGIDDTEIIRRKIQMGSYAALVGSDRVPVSLIECLRGMLVDDPDQRWQATNIDLWLNGKRMTPIQPKVNQAQRSIRFADQDFHSIRPLSYCMFQHWDKAMSIIKDGVLETWIRRGFENSDLADGIAAAIKSTGALSGQQAADTEDIIIARVLMLMDPKAPVRSRNFGITLGGFGRALAVAIMGKQKLQPYTEFIHRDLWRHWMSAQAGTKIDKQKFEDMFRDLKSYLKDTNAGGGPERCLYELNEWQHCISPLVESQYIMEVKGILPALDSTAKSINTKMWPVDRHVAAFLLARYAKGTISQIDSMNDSRPDRATIGMLSVLAIVQWRLGPEALHGLASWVGGLMGPVISSYENRNKRKELEKEIPRLVRKGNLAVLFNYLGSPEERQKDAEGFSWAKAEYAAAEKEVYDFEHGAVNRLEYAIKIGQQAGAVGATIILMFTLLITFLSHIL
ncbi:MAG: hypothetical protein CMG46_12400 [Candidatus Marinimicrobia bacterium]|nr:hypothetical protein [Candidatus Neomarinimicrobiota bacterium]